jgi:hypothetical protein
MMVIESIKVIKSTKVIKSIKGARLRRRTDGKFVRDVGQERERKRERERERERGGREDKGKTSRGADGRQVQCDHHVESS